MTIETSDVTTKRAKKHASVSIDKHLSTAEIKSILDERDYNVVFNDLADLKQKAGLWLDSSFSPRFTGLTAQQGAALAAVKAIRNFLAHRSGASKKVMQSALADTSLATPLRRGTNEIRDVGSFLLSQPGAGLNVRLVQYLDVLEQCALNICP